MENTTVFGVYGSLKKGGSNHDLLEHPNVEYMGADITLPDFTMIDLGAFPAIVPLGTTSIRLEVYRTDDKWILERLNQLEGFKGEDNPTNLYDFVSVKTQEFQGVKIYQMKLTHPWIEKRKGVVSNGNWQIRGNDEPKPGKVRFADPIQPRKFNPIPQPKFRTPEEVRIRAHNENIDKAIAEEKNIVINNNLLHPEEKLNLMKAIDMKWNAQKLF